MLRQFNLRGDSSSLSCYALDWIIVRPALASLERNVLSLVNGDTVYTQVLKLMRSIEYEQRLDELILIYQLHERLTCERRKDFSCAKNSRNGTARTDSVATRARSLLIVSIRRTIRTR